MDVAVQRVAGVLLAALSVSCGARVLREPEPLVLERPLAETRGRHVDVYFDGVIVSGGPGSWAKNPAWDEYLLRVLNHHEGALTVMWVRAYDSQTFEARPANERKVLTKASRATAKRYRKEGVKVTAGVGAEPLLVGGGVAATSAPLLVLGAYSSGSAAAAGAALGAIAAAPVLLVGGTVVAVNSHRVEEEIARRSSVLPMRLEPGQMRELDLFFPVVPSPRRLDVNYRLDGVAHTVSVDLADSLDGLHIDR